MTVASVVARRPGSGEIHTFSILHYSAEAFLPEVPFVLAYVRLPGIDTLFLARIKGCPPEEVYIGMPVRARFRRLVDWTPNDVWFEPVEQGN